MIYTAFDPKEVTGDVLLKDRKLMELWKWAADEGQIEAVSVDEKNYVIVKDEDLLEQVLDVGKKLTRYRYDDQAKSLV